jgi:hypothetical protein
LSYVTDIYKAIIFDMHHTENAVKSRMSRMVTLKHSTYIILAVNRFDDSREFCVKIEGVFDPKRLPKWKGIDIDCVYIKEYGTASGNYLRLIQLPEFEEYIFEIVVQDLLDNLDVEAETKSVLSIVENTLARWKEFFSFSGDAAMSHEKQQGLFGELLLLSELIEAHGISAVYNWTGPNAETHDFYINSDAIEVKTTSAKAPYSIHINSEFQLDDKDVSGNLLLMFYALRSSKTDGENLPVIIDQIKTMIGDNQTTLSEFQDKLWRYGYITGHDELYQIRFTLREAALYHIRSAFPRITKNDLPNGTGAITYLLSLASCNQYITGKTASEWLVKGGNKA